MGELARNVLKRGSFLGRPLQGLQGSGNARLFLRAFIHFFVAQMRCFHGLSREK